MNMQIHYKCTAFSRNMQENMILFSQEVGNLIDFYDFALFN